MVIDGEIHEVVVRKHNPITIDLVRYHKGNLKHTHNPEQRKNVKVAIKMAKRKEAIPFGMIICKEQIIPLQSWRPVMGPSYCPRLVRCRSLR